MSENGDDNGRSSPVKKNAYTVDYKLHVIAWAKAHLNKQGKPNLHAAFREFGVDRQRIREWLRTEKKLVELKYEKENISAQPLVRFRKAGKAKKKNVPGAGRPLKNPELDDGLIAWIRQRRDLKLKVTRPLMLLHAQNLQVNVPLGSPQRLNVSSASNYPTGKTKPFS